MKRGYIKLWRASVDNKLYFSEPFTKWQAWTDLLLLTNHAPRVVNVRGIPIQLERGQVLAAEEFLAERWKWSRGKVRRFMTYLASKTVQQIVQQKSRVCTIITVVNWHHYQPDGTTNGTTDSTTDGQQTDIPKNYNIKNNREREGGDPSVMSILNCREEFMALKYEDVFTLVHNARLNPQFRDNLEALLIDAANSLEPPRNPTGMIRAYLNRTASSKVGGKRGERTVRFD